MPLLQTDGVLYYDIWGCARNTYDFFQTQSPPCYIRFGGILRYSYFDLDCRNFDMRGVNLQKSAFFSQDYFATLNQLEIPEEAQMLKRHANFSHADLRFANLSKTEFRLSGALEKTRIDHTTHTAGSNIKDVQKGRVPYYQTQRRDRSITESCSLL